MAKTNQLESSINRAFAKLRDAELALTRATEARERLHDERAAKRTEHGLRSGAVASLDEEIEELTNQLDALGPKTDALKEQLADAQSDAKEAAKALRDMKKKDLSVKAVREAVSDYQKASQAIAEDSAELADLEAQARFLKERIDNLTLERNEEAQQSGELAEEVARLEERHAEADEEVASRGEDLDHALASLQDALGKTAGQQIDGSLLDLIATSGRTPRKDFLTLGAQAGSFDDLANKALAQFRQDIAPPEIEKEARDTLVRHGIATKVGEVTKRLRRTRLSKIRGAILDAAYVPLLMKRLGGRHIDPKIADDTVGLADSILHDLEADDGPIADYARLLTDITVDAMRLDAGVGTPARKLIEVQICKSI